MKEFDYVILGGGCAGLSLAYELDINNKIKNKSLAIVEIREEYRRDKTWSFWKIDNHNFDDCIIKSWNNFSINSKLGSYEVLNKDYPYQTIDSKLFYNKILNKIKQNKNIEFFKNTDQLNLDNSIIFNSIPPKGNYDDKLWQHFKGVEIETSKNIFDDKIFNLMDFDCDQRNSVHFFYTLPFQKNRALIETTWLSKMNDASLKDYDAQLEKYIEKTLKIKKIDKNKIIDSLEIARGKFPGVSNSLDALCKRFGIDLSRRKKHNALLDCELLREVYINLIGVREPKLSLNNHIEEKKHVFSQISHYSKKIIKPSESELQDHKLFLKNELKKNYF